MGIKEAFRRALGKSESADKDEISITTYPNSTLPKNISFESAFPAMCITQEYLWNEYITRVDKSLKFSVQRCARRNGRTYDIMSFTRPGDEETIEFYHDITAFYGISGIIRREGDLPILDKPEYLKDLYSEEWIEELQKGAGVDLGKIRVFFKHWSSEMLSLHTTIWFPDENLVEVGVVRRYDAETGVPILHGYRFWRLMFEHQLQHMIDRHYPISTETAPKGNYYRPIIGNDCIQFNPLPEYDFANDLINYTFFTHRPSAFAVTNEIRGFGASLHFGFGTKLFTLNQLEHAIKDSSVDSWTSERLLDAAKSAYRDVFGDNDRSEGN